MSLGEMEKEKSEVDRLKALNIQIYFEICRVLFRPVLQPPRHLRRAGLQQGGGLRQEGQQVGAGVSKKGQTL